MFRGGGSVTGVLTRKYVLVLGLLLGASLAAFLVFQELLRTQISADVVNESGRERVLAHRVALYATLLKDENSPHNRAELARSIDELERTHRYVQQHLHEKTLFDLWGMWPVAEGRTDRQERLDDLIGVFINTARETVVAYEQGDTARAQVLARGLVEQATAILLPAFDRTMSYFSEMARERERWLQVFAVVGEAMTIGLLVFSGVRIFRPMVNGIGASIKRLEHLEAYHRSMMNNVGDGVVTFDDKLVIRYVNSTFEAMTRMSADSLIGRYITIVLPEIASIDNLFSTRQRRLEIVHDAGDGRSVIFDLSLYLFEFEGEAQCIASLRNITDRKDLENRLRLFYYAIEHSPMSIVITDTTGVIQYANRRCAETSGFSLAEIIGSTPRLFRSGQTPAEVYRTMWDNLLSGREWSGEILNRRKNGDLYWEFEAISALKNQRGEVTHFIAIKEDITNQKKAAAALIEAKRQAEIANRAKSEFLANMSHELRTPLNAIIGFSEIMTMELFGAHAHDKYKEYSVAVQDSAKHLLGIINDILDFSKLEAGRVTLFEETVRLCDLLAPVYLIVRERAESRGIALITDEDESDIGKLIYVRVDALRYKQVLLNVITNAIKFTQPGGKVTISLKMHLDNSLTVIVKDTGIGMKEEDIPKALERFGQVDSTLHRKYEGTGLGLPISKTLIELHGGTLRLESKEGVGTTVFIHLPASRVSFDPSTTDMRNRTIEIRLKG